MNWGLWALVLLLQNASFTLVSRARNSNSLGFHAIASLCSNGVWFLSNLIIVSTMVDILKTKDWKFGVIAGLFYTACTMAGSIGMHYISMKYFEKGKRKVGA